VTAGQKRFATFRLKRVSGTKERKEKEGHRFFVVDHAGSYLFDSEKLPMRRSTQPAAAAEVLAPSANIVIALDFSELGG
jgi:hypothetical protein